ncbi:MAG TPA: GDSL-type esterase/lipase family protein, partial [Leptospiraceae bacterium]|nr:GDSL-type esterase/lipase family protein [Leptospiraceae bacterium]
KKIISRVREKNPEVKILLVPMKVFPNYGPKYGKQFEKLYKEISEEENVPLSPFLLEKVAGIRKLNLPDGIHPTAEGHKLLFSTMYEPVKNLLKD